MKPTVDYKLKKDSRWLTGSAIFMGLAFFLQAFDLLGVRMMQNIPMGDLLLYYLFPMLTEAVWCVYVRTSKEYSAKIGGVIGAVLCLVVLAQTIFCGNVLLMILGIASCLLAAAAMVLITWGFFAYRHLGLMVFAGITAIRVLLFDVIGTVTAMNWNEIVLEVPMVCILLSLTMFFGGIYPLRKE